MKIATPLFLVCLTFATFAQTPTDNSFRRSFKPVERIGGINERNFFVFAAGDLTYTIRDDGFGDTTAKKFLRHRIVRLQVGDGKLSRLNVAEFAGDSILAYEVTSGRSYLARLDGNTRAIHWTVQPGVHLGPGLIEDRYVYISCRGFVAKIDMQSGKYVWQKNLKPQAGDELREFDLPEIRDAVVIFSEIGADGRTLELDKMSGETIRPL